MLLFSGSDATAEDTGETTVAVIRKVAIFPLVLEGDVRPKIAAAIRQALMQGARETPEIETLSGRQLRRRLRRRPAAAFARCERAPEFGTCLAGYVRRLRVDEVIVSRAKATPSGVVVLIAAVSRTGDPDVRIKVLVTSPEDVSVKLPPEDIPAILGIKPPAPPEPPKPAPPPAEMVAMPGPVPSTEPPTPDAQAPPPSTKAPLVAVAVAETLKGAPVEPLPTNNALALASPPPVVGGFSWAGVSGFVGLIAGATAAGVAAYYSTEAQGIGRNLAAADGVLLQREAVARYDRANQNVMVANILFVAGGALGAGGSGFLLFDLLSD